MTGLDAFANRMQAYARAVSNGRTRLLREVALRVDQTVVLATPVDTGRARSNWIASLVSPVTEAIPAYAGTIALRSSVLTLLNNRFAERENASAAIAQTAGTIASVRPGQTIFLSNNLPYITGGDKTLNEGWSPQAPARYIQEAIADAVVGLRGITIIEGRV